jgi:hypothetical protein
LSTPEGSYRCAECKSWRHLEAYAAAVVGGPLDAEGKLAGHDSVEECFLHEDSICCTRHMCAPIEAFLAGRWCRWWCCRRCGGSGKTGHPGDQYRYPCPANESTLLRWPPGIRNRQTNGHEGWRPAGQVAALACGEKDAQPAP